MTLRGIDPRLRASLEAEAERRGTSLNAVVLAILREALGLAGEAIRHHDLDALAGVWTPAEAAEFREAVREFEVVDPVLWGEADVEGGCS